MRLDFKIGRERQQPSGATFSSFGASTTRLKSVLPGKIYSQDQLNPIDVASNTGASPWRDLFMPTRQSMG